MNMTQWTEAVIADKNRIFAPIMYYPCTSLVGVKAVDTVKAGGAQAMAAVMKAAADRFPEMAIVSTALDVTVDPEAFGVAVDYDEDRAPHCVSFVIKDEADAEAMTMPSAMTERQVLHYEAVKEAKKLMPEKPVFGNLLGPFTLATSVMKLSDAMLGVMKKGPMMHVVIEKCTEFVINRALAYKAAGADGILLDEACGGIIPPKKCAEFSSAYIKKIVEAVQDDQFAVMMHNCGNIARMLDSIFDTGCRMYSFGNAVDFKLAAEKLPEGALLIGNLDPMLLTEEDDNKVYEETKALIEAMADCPGFVPAPGCDVPTNARLESVDAMIRAIKEANS
ncbi:MAG: uroporphyrinogen decarboxylase family protein [Lachnospiraceae bacterium]|nr:uroporphyrinogen decarboxylase family protein [Lachnospiraceae bacterium]